MMWQNIPGRLRVDDCDLCEEARMTEWFYEDADCWIAECEVCSVPMIVWRHHDPQPSEEVKAILHGLLTVVADSHFEFDKGMYIDDNMRNIPDHYHAHARSRSGFMGRGVHRRPFTKPAAG